MHDQGRLMVSVVGLFTSFHDHVVNLQQPAYNSDMPGNDVEILHNLSQECRGHKNINDMKLLKI